MPLYFFDVSNAVTLEDTIGMVLPNETAARTHAEGLRIALEKRGPESDSPWAVTVRDKARTELFVVERPTASPASAPPRP